MGSKYRIRTTAQSPRIQIRAIHSFEDGSKIRTSQLYAEKPGDLKHAYRLCLEMDEAEHPLTLIQTKVEETAPVFSAWASVTERLKAHLDAKGIKWKGQAYDSPHTGIDVVEGPSHARKIDALGRGLQASNP